MPRLHLLGLALATQGLLAALAIAGGHLTGIPVPWGNPVVGTSAGVAAAGVLCAGNYALLTRSPRGWWLADGVRSVYETLLVPLFARLDAASAIVIGTAAGIGEEWFFRGFLQPFAGIAAASAAFGLAHVGGARMVAFGVWATVMGILLGALALITGGVIAPMVAHGLYDVLALEYIRRTHGNDAVSAQLEN